MTGPPTLIVVAPIEPSSTGNGLAMRVDALVEAASVHHRVELVVIALLGRPAVVRPVGLPAVHHTLEPVAPGPVALRGWLDDASWRSRVRALAPLPEPVGRLPMSEVPGLAERMHASGPVAVLACRLSTAPLALRLAEHLRAPLLVDVDDDDEALARHLGDLDQADGWHRVAATTLPHARLITGASDSVVEALRQRHGLGPAVSRIPNPAPRPSRPPEARRGTHRALMVANFTYAPNTDGVTWFVEAVLPHLPEPWTVDLVGPGSASFSRLPRVVGHGVVDDVTDHYEACDVVVAPVLAGSGTRIKVLEAFAHRRPLVATTIAVDGLGVVPDTHALIADHPKAFARAVALCADEARAGPLIDAADRLVAETYDRARIVVGAAQLLGRATHESPPSSRQPTEDASS